MFYFCIQLETSPTSPAACNWKLTPTTFLCSTGKFDSYFSYETKSMAQEDFVKAWNESLQACQNLSE